MEIKENAPKRHKKKRKFHLPLSAWLSYLVIATLILSSISLARYTAATEDNSSARVAGFGVSATANKAEGQTNKIVLNTTTLNSVTYALTVSNTSEVVVKYKIIIKNVPNGIDVSVNGSENLPHHEKTVTYAANDVLKMNCTKECTITFRAHDEYTTAKKYEDKMTVEVQFNQVD